MSSRRMGGCSSSGPPGISGDDVLKRHRAGLARLVGLVLLVSWIGADAARAQRVDEYHLKAAVLYNLAKFVDWPAEAFADPTAPLVFCVLGADPFGLSLDETLHDHMVGRRPVLVKRVAEVTADCHVLFVANSEVRRLPAITDQLGTRAVLTVGEAASFAERGGMIGLLTEGDRVRFAINAGAAEHARLKISARVLALASSVLRTGDPGR